MTAQDQLDSIDELRRIIRHSLTTQLKRLQQARKEHSHSDLFLPPDLVTSTLKADNNQLKSQISQFTQHQGSDHGDNGDIVATILGLEARELVFVELQGEKDIQIKLSSSHIKKLIDRLDITLELEKQGLLDTSIPLLIHEEVFDRLPISDCSQLFEYVELRIQDLTKDLQPGKGKGLTLLRFCIELVRRLSKPTREHTIFVGRILSLLSSVFPLGERSGVNYRGDFNIDNRTTWETIPVDEHELAESVPNEGEEEEEEEEEDQSNRDASAEDPRDKSEELGDRTKEVNDDDLIQSIHDPSFYALFWKAQAWFSNPSLLFSIHEEDSTLPLPKRAIESMTASTNSSLQKFRVASQYILLVLGAVERREKELEGKADRGKETSDTIPGTLNGLHGLPDAGSQLASTVPNKRKRRSPDNSPDLFQEGEKDDNAFFPKYLTDRNLFEYELRDATFRRHILAQYLILFQHLLGFTEAQKEKTKNWKNQLVATHHIAFTLEEGDEKWIRDTWRLVVSLIRETSSDGKVFADTIIQVLRREANWLQWKADTCPPIDQAPMSHEHIDLFSRARKSFLQMLRPYPHKMGTAALSRLWEDGVKQPEPTTRMIENEEGMEIEIQIDGLDDLEFSPTIPTLQMYAREIIKIERQQEGRRKELDWEAPQAYGINSVISHEKRQKEKERLIRESSDDKLQQLEQSRVLNAWRAARLARGTHLESFARIKVDDGKSTGLRIDDITGLMKAVEDRSKSLKKSTTPVPEPDSSQVTAAKALPSSTDELDSSVPSNISTTKEEDVEMEEIAVEKNGNDSERKTFESNEQDKVDTALLS